MPDENKRNNKTTPSSWVIV